MRENTSKKLEKSIATMITERYDIKNELGRFPVTFYVQKGTGHNIVPPITRRESPDSAKKEVI